MDLSTLFILLIIFGVISFIIEKIGGFNPYEAYLAIGAITLFFSLLYIMWPIMTTTGDINASDITMSRLSNWLTDFLPGAIIGDIAGIIIAKITGDRR